jgi:hypothetical protein
VQIDRDVVAALREPPGDREILSDSGQATASRSDEQLVDVGVSFDNRRGVRLDDVGQVSLGIVPAKSAHEGRREYHVANRAQSNHQNTH